MDAHKSRNTFFTQPTSHQPIATMKAAVLVLNSTGNEENSIKNDKITSPTPNFNAAAKTNEEILTNESITKSAINTDNTDIKDNFVNMESSATKTDTL